MKLQKLWAIDPGYFRLKQALKTILAILVALAIVHKESLFTQLVVGVISGFSMQGVVAKSLSARIFQVILLNFAFFISFILGLSVRESPNITAVLLIILGFVANYIRRFGLQMSNAPTMIWTVCFLTTVLPFTDTLEIWSHLHMVIIALVISGLVTLCVFPENYSKLFVHNSNRLFKSLSLGFQDMRRYILRKNKPKNEAYLTRYAFVKIQKNMRHLIESNQAIEQSDVFKSKSGEINDLLIEQYALMHIYTMMIDAYQALCRHQKDLPKAIYLELSLIYKQFSNILAEITMEENYTITVSNRANKNIPVPIEFESPPLQDSQALIVVLNLNLSFNLLNRHLLKIVSGTVLI